MRSLDDSSSPMASMEETVSSSSSLGSRVGVETPARR
jgi:hypothetical protein